MSKKITDPGIDQHEAARAHAAAQEQHTNNVMRNQSRKMAGTESTKGPAMPRLGK
jgi:hypothetical protein